MPYDATFPETDEAIVPGDAKIPAEDVCDRLPWPHAALRLIAAILLGWVPLLAVLHALVL